MLSYLYLDPRCILILVASWFSLHLDCLCLLKFPASQKQNKINWLKHQCPVNNFLAIDVTGSFCPLFLSKFMSSYWVLVWKFIFVDMFWGKIGLRLIWHLWHLPLLSCCASADCRLMIWIRIIHSKSAKISGFCFSVSKNLRKKCVNRDNKIPRQQCVNQWFW